MNIIYLVLISQLLLVVEFNNLSAEANDLLPAAPFYLVDAHSLYHQAIPRLSQSSRAPDHVKLKIMDADEVISNVDLKQTQRVLANEHLPIWIADDAVDNGSLDIEGGHELQRNYEVMRQLGKFTTYQQPATLSSAVYFHERRTFDGMIGYEYVIHDLPVDKIHATKETEVQLDQWGVYRRGGDRGHEDFHSEDDPISGVNDQKNLRTYGGHVYDGYPEVLVIVPWDVMEDLVKNVDEFDWYITVVSYVLTLFNGVDMLYSNLKDTDIFVNIAGIILGVRRESFLFLDNCYYTGIRTNGSPQHKLIGHCVNRRLRRYLAARKQKIPLDSYDVVVFLTNEDLYNVFGEDVAEGAEPTFEQTLGISSVMLELYRNRKHGKEIILVGTITNYEHMGSYPVIAHEMAHLMTVLHDKPPFFKNSRECCGGIMKPRGELCDTCMQWSQTSERTFQLFYSSPNCCKFINRPRSLFPPVHRQVITADEQCRCYGFVSARKFRHLFNNFCSRTLQCEGVDHFFHHTVIPVDGTPCHHNKACYQRQCQIS